MSETTEALFQRATGEQLLRAVACARARGQITDAALHRMMRASLEHEAALGVLAQIEAPADRRDGLCARLRRTAAQCEAAARRIGQAQP